jgi:hypothetical protein
MLAVVCVTLARQHILALASIENDHRFGALLALTKKAVWPVTYLKMVALGKCQDMEAMLRLLLEMLAASVTVTNI